MSIRRPILTTVLGVASIALLAGCALAQGPADRTDEFVAAGQNCTGSWWLGDLREGTNPEAAEVAEQALDNATVSASQVEEAEGLLDFSYTEAERRDISPVEFASEAYMLTVTLQVKDALDAAGYPDIDRVLEVWSERRCS